MQKFYDYNPAAPFSVKEEGHYVENGKVELNYTPKQGTVKVLLDGVEATESSSANPGSGQFYIDYAVSSNYRMAEQVVVFNESDNGRRAVFDYEGVSTLIKAKHFNEIRDFMNSYNDDRAANLVDGQGHRKSNETVENFKLPRLTDRVEIAVSTVIGNAISVDDVTDIEVGKEYVIANSEHMEKFIVKSINAEDKIITAMEILTNEYDNTAHIYRTTANIGDGVAFVSGSTQKIDWFTGETWKGHDGESTVNKTMNFEEAIYNSVDEDTNAVKEDNAGIATAFRLQFYLDGSASAVEKSNRATVEDLPYSFDPAFGKTISTQGLLYLEYCSDSLWYWPIFYGQDIRNGMLESVPDYVGAKFAASIEVKDSKGLNKTNSEAIILPKFYYLDDPNIKFPVISFVPRPKFKVHPVFIDENTGKEYSKIIMAYVSSRNLWFANEKTTLELKTSSDSKGITPPDLTKLNCGPWFTADWRHASAVGVLSFVLDITLTRYVYVNNLEYNGVGDKKLAARIKGGGYFDVKTGCLQGASENSSDVFWNTMLNVKSATTNQMWAMQDDVSHYILCGGVYLQQGSGFTVCKGVF